MLFSSKLIIEIVCVMRKEGVGEGWAEESSHIAACHEAMPTVKCVCDIYKKDKRMDISPLCPPPPTYINIFSDDVESLLKLFGEREDIKLIRMNCMMSSRNLEIIIS